MVVVVGVVAVLGSGASGVVMVTIVVAVGVVVTVPVVVPLVVPVVISHVAVATPVVPVVVEVVGIGGDHLDPAVVPVVSVGVRDPVPGGG